MGCINNPIKIDFSQIKVKQIQPNIFAQTIVNAVLAL